MFKTVIIFTECLKWSSFSEFMFYLVLLCDVVFYLVNVMQFKSVTEHVALGCVTCTIQMTN